MVSKDNVIIVESTCSCGVGDSKNNQKAYFENKCPACGKEGTLQVETMNNIEVSNQPKDNTNTTNNSNNGTNDDSSQDTPIAQKIVCKNCGSEYCGQDGFDLAGGSRASLNTVNPNEITDGDEELSEEEEEDSTYMSGWEGLCDLLKPLDGLAMMVQRGDYVIVKKIEMPQTARLWAYEGINIVDDSVTITDYTPEIYNTFVIRWGESYENELEFVFEKHKRLFGERKTVMEATKVVSTSDDESSDEDSEEKDKGFSITDLIFNSNKNEDETKNKTTSKTNSNSKKNKNSTDLNTDDLSGLSSEEESEDSNTEEVPITDREEAIQFGLTQVGKAKRDDGHTIELKVIGNHNWMMGEWCHVRLPSFNEDSYMFISKCSIESSADSEYIINLTLVDYPPSLGKPSKKSTEEESTQEDSATEENVDGTSDGTTGTGTGDNSSTTGSSSNTNSN